MPAVALIAACGTSSEPTRNNAARSERPAASVAAPATPGPSATPDVMPSGEKVERAVTVRFPATSAGWPDGWEWIDPASGTQPTPFETANGRLKMTIGSGRDLHGGNRTAPRLLKAITGDFQIETRVRFDPTQDYQGAGLLVYLDGSNYVRFERSYGGLGDGGSGIRLDARRRDNFEPITTPGEIPTDAGEVELKIIRRGNVFSAFWRLDESSEWRAVEDVSTDFPETVRAGIIGCSTAEPIDAEFAYVRLTPQRFPEKR